MTDRLTDMEIDEVEMILDFQDGLMADRDLELLRKMLRAAGKAGEVPASGAHLPHCATLTLDPHATPDHVVRCTCRAARGDAAPPAVTDEDVDRAVRLFDATLDLTDGAEFIKGAKAMRRALEDFAASRTPTTGQRASVPEWAVDVSSTIDELCKLASNRIGASKAEASGFGAGSGRMAESSDRAALSFERAIHATPPRILAEAFARLKDALASVRTPAGQRSSGSGE